MFTIDSLPNLIQQMNKDILEKQEAALLRWLAVDSIEEVIEKIEDLRCQGLGVEIRAEPVSYKVSGGHNNFKYIAEQAVRFKIVSLKDDTDGK